MFEQETLLQQLGNPNTTKVVERLRNFAYMRPAVLENLSRQAFTENWGPREFALEKYLAVHIPWSIEQGRYTYSDNQWYVTAGHLQTRYGTPLYLVFEQNMNPRQPWYLVTAGSQISAPQLPTPPDIPPPPTIERGAEIVMMDEHILGDNATRVPFLEKAPPVAQMCAVAGSIQWSINRGLHCPYWYFGHMNYIVPLYLQSREDVTQAPDAVAPVQVDPERLLVRTVLPPSLPYANARVAVRRHDELRPWLLSAWSDHTRDAANSNHYYDSDESLDSLIHRYQRQTTGNHDGLRPA